MPGFDRDLRQQHSEVMHGSGGRQSALYPRYRATTFEVAEVSTAPSTGDCGASECRVYRHGQSVESIKLPVDSGVGAIVATDMVMLVLLGGSINQARVTQALT